MTTSSPAPLWPPDQLTLPSWASPLIVTLDSSARLIASDPDSARIRLRPVRMTPCDRGLTGLDQRVVDLSHVHQLGSTGGHPDLAQMRHLLGVQAAGGHLDIDDDVRVDLQQQLLAQPERPEVVQRPRRIAQQAEAVQRGAQLSVAGHLEHCAVAAQHVRPVGGQGGDRGLADDPDPPPHRPDRDPLDPAGVDGLGAAPARLGGSGFVRGGPREALGGVGGVLRPVGGRRPGVGVALRPANSSLVGSAPARLARLRIRSGLLASACGSEAFRASMRRAASAASMRPAASSSRIAVMSGVVMPTNIKPIFHL